MTFLWFDPWDTNTLPILQFYGKFRCIIAQDKSIIVILHRKLTRSLTNFMEERFVLHQLIVIFFCLKIFNNFFYNSIILIKRVKKKKEKKNRERENLDVFIYVVFLTTRRSFCEQVRWPSKFIINLPKKVNWLLLLLSLLLLFLTWIFGLKSKEKGWGIELICRFTHEWPRTLQKHYFLDLEVLMPYAILHIVACMCGARPWF